MSAVVATYRAAPPWRGAAYVYLRPGDLPIYRELDEDPLCRVKLFGGGSFSYYACAATMRDGIDGPVLSGYATGLAEDEWGDTALLELMALRFPPLGLPLERDLHFEPLRLSELLAGARP